MIPADADVADAHLGLHRGVPDDLLVDDLLDPIQFIAGDRLDMHEVEAQAGGGHERSRLFHVAAERLPQRGVQQVRRRVVAADGVADRGVDFRRHDIAYAQRTARQAHAMRAREPGLYSDQPFDRGDRAGAFVHQTSGVGHLAAGLQVKGCARQRDITVSVRAQGVDGPALIVEQRHDLDTGEARARVAVELIAGALQEVFVLDAEGVRLFSAERAPAARPVALRGHGGLVAGLVNQHVVGGRGVLDELVRDAEGVVQPECRLARQHAARRVARFGDLGLEAGQAVGEHDVEAVLFRENCLFDHLAVLPQARIGVAHLAGEHANQPVQERFSQPQVLAMAHRAPHDLAQHVPAELI